MDERLSSVDGLVYKLVPIRTPIDRSNPYEMGRVDSDLMYDIVKKWSWGNLKEDLSRPRD